jgi:L-alanine-DL-glutamate epimerase-like enolase superfamily enzyme
LLRRTEQPLARFIPQLDLVTKTGMKIENGEAVASSESGLGIDWDWSGLDKFVVHRRQHRWRCVFLVLFSAPV